MLHAFVFSANCEQKAEHNAQGCGFEADTFLVLWSFIDSASTALATSPGMSLKSSEQTVSFVN
jgi:hypothetical protein